MIWRESGGGDCPMGMSCRGKTLIRPVLPVQPDYFVTIFYYKEKSNG